MIYIDDKKEKWKFYRDTKNEWRWKHFATNGIEIGAATEGYKNYQDVLANAESNGMKRKITKNSNC